jgi:hypothetical protein
VSSRTQSLKAPFPYFGGKSRVAELVWSRLGPVDNYIEPFFGSGAVLLRRPDPPKIETVNDLDCMVANFWRATQRDPEGVAAWADGPVNEADLHSRHRWLVLSDDAAAFRQRMRSDPELLRPEDCRLVVLGAVLLDRRGLVYVEQRREGATAGRSAAARTRCPKSNSLRGVWSPVRRPTVVGLRSGRVTTPTGVNGGEVRPRRRTSTPAGPASTGATAPTGTVSTRRGRRNECRRSTCRTGGKGVNGVGPSEGRPQLGDAFDIGRGVNGNGRAHTCAERRAWLIDWFGQLRDRLRLSGSAAATGCASATATALPSGSAGSGSSSTRPTGRPRAGT